MTKREQWAKALRAWEWAHVELMKQELQPHERDALFTLHDLLRTRASGVKDVDDTGVAERGSGHQGGRAGVA